MADSTATELRADASAVYGLAFDYRLTDDLKAEFLWADNPTTYSAKGVDTGLYSLAFRSRINQFQFGGMYLFRDSGDAIRPFVAGGIGFTHDANASDNPARTVFGAGLGGGIEYNVSRHAAIRTEARWMPTYGSSGLGSICDSGIDSGIDSYGYGGGCYPATVHNYLQRFNFVVGLTLRP